MKDRFKFRAWSDEYNRYLDEYDIYNETLATDYSISTLLEFYVDSNKFTFEQCTGLRDKNGKLIYEGDVVEVPVLYNGIPTGKKQRCKVYYKHGGFNIYAVKSKYLKVIGNIHENSELLEGQSYDNNQN